MSARNHAIVYRYRGQIERGTGRGYRWTDGWSEDGAGGAVSYPWLTKRECQKDARSRGGRARFDATAEGAAVARRPAPAEIVDFLEVAIDAAERHGRESDPDHEVGDLQDLARALWGHLPAEARAAVARAWEPWGMESTATE